MTQKIKELIAQGKTKAAIQQLLTFTKTIADDDLQQEVLMLSAQFEKHASSNRMGISSNEEQGISIARINKAVLDIATQLPITDSLPSKTTAPPIPNGEENSSTPANKKSVWTYITMAAVIMGILGGLAEVMNFINIFPSASAETVQLTIYVHGSKGLQDYVLAHEGELLVDLDGDRRYAKIGEKGRTVFNEIPAKFKGNSLPIAVKSDGFEAANTHKKYKWEGKPIYFPIQRAAKYRAIKGIVKTEDGSDYLANVQIMIANEFTTQTDSLGRFSFMMETSQVQKKYSLTFTKEGYQVLTEFYYPPASAEFRLIVGKK